MFTLLLTRLVNASNGTKRVSLTNQKCDIQPSFINLHPNEYSQKLHYYPFEVKLDRCVGSCNTLHSSSSTVCVLNKTDDFKINVFNMITGQNKSKVLIRDITCEYKCKFWWKKI